LSTYCELKNPSLAKQRPLNTLWHSPLLAADTNATREESLNAVIQQGPCRSYITRPHYHRLTRDRHWRKVVNSVVFGTKSRCAAEDKQAFTGLNWAGLSVQLRCKKHSAETERLGQTLSLIKEEATLINTHMYRPGQIILNIDLDKNNCADEDRQ
jgi:hypothetical protein